MKFSFKFFLTPFKIQQMQCISKKLIFISSEAVRKKRTFSVKVDGRRDKNTKIKGKVDRF